MSRFAGRMTMARSPGVGTPAPGAARIEVDEPEEDAMALLMGAEMDRPVQNDMDEERMLRALMEAQGQR